MGGSYSKSKTVFVKPKIVPTNSDTTLINVSNSTLPNNNVNPETQGPVASTGPAPLTRQVSKMPNPNNLQKTPSGQLKRAPSMKKDPSVKDMKFVASPRVNILTPISQYEEDRPEVNSQVKNTNNNNNQNNPVKTIVEKKYWSDLDVSFRNSSWKYAEVSKAISKPFTGAMRQFKVKKREG